MPYPNIGTDQSFSYSYPDLSKKYQQRPRPGYAALRSIRREAELPQSCNPQSHVQGCQISENTDSSAKFFSRRFGLCGTAAVGVSS
jgi:hypothetical protein